MQKFVLSHLDGGPSGRAPRVGLPVEIGDRGKRFCQFDPARECLGRKNQKCTDKPACAAAGSCLGYVETF